MNALHCACYWVMAAAATVALAVPIEAVAQDRAAMWREDIEVARSEFLNRDRAFSADERARADDLLRGLESRVERLSDAEIVAGLARAAAFANNAHTRAYILRNRGAWRRDPLRVWNFQGEWRVIAARPGYENLLGARLVRVAGVRVARAEARVRTLFAGNDNWARYMAGYSLTSPDALIGVGLLDEEEETQFEFERDGRRWREQLAPDAFTRRETPEENWWFLSPAHPASAGWTHVLADAPLTPVLSGAGTFYRYARCADDVAYLQFNRASDAPNGEPLTDFGERVLADLEASPPNKLVLDLRFNTGGDLTLGWHFFRTLAASSWAQAEDRAFVLVGPNTFSAGITHVVQMRTLSRALLVGTEPGDVLETWSEGGNVLLPHSRINMHFADRAHTYSSAPSGIPDDLVLLDLNVSSLAPDRLADWSWEAYLAGRDPYAEAALSRALVCPS